LTILLEKITGFIRKSFKLATSASPLYPADSLGKKDILWQDTAYVLALFGKTVPDARKRIALPPVSGRVNILPQNKTTSKQPISPGVEGLLMGKSNSMFIGPN
jgi:hypothetical protein